MAISYLQIDLNVLDPRPVQGGDPNTRVPTASPGRQETQLAHVIRGGRNCDDNLYVARYLGKDTVAYKGIKEISKDDADAAVGQAGILVLHLQNNC